MFSKYIFILLFCFSLLSAMYSQEKYLVGIDGRSKSITELLYQNDTTIIVFKGRVKSSTVVPSSGNYESIIEIEEMYFGNTTLKEVNIISGSFPPSGLPFFLTPQKKHILFIPGSGEFDSDLPLIDSDRPPYKWGFKMAVGKTYLIYANNTDYTQKYNSVYSKELKEIPRIKNEIEVVKKFDAIFRQKETGYFIFKDDKKNILAVGSYKSGKQSDIWRHYSEKGSLLSILGRQGSADINLIIDELRQIRITTYKDSVVTEGLNSPHRNVIIKSDTSTVSVSCSYLDDCLLTKISSYTYSLKDDTTKKYQSSYEYRQEYYHMTEILKSNTIFRNYHVGEGVYQEFYQSGKLKLNGLYHRDRRAGCWVWFYEDGTFWAEHDYKDGNTPQ